MLEARRLGQATTSTRTLVPWPGALYRQTPANLGRALAHPVQAQAVPTGHRRRVEARPIVCDLEHHCAAGLPFAF
jgi:hypothetical protein